jgi:chromate transport protein ChrA
MRPSLQALFAVFLRYGNLTLGGGSATIATLHGEIVARRSWISQHRFD